MDRKVALMIIGAQKAGTTSLNQYLSQHPNIGTHFSLEFGMFRDSDEYNKGFDFFYRNTVSDEVRNNVNKTVFAAKRVGVMYNPEMLHKLKEHNPEVKVIVVLRNPVERAFSAFWYCKNNGIEPYSNFQDAVFINDLSRFKGNRRLEKNCDYIGRSKYLGHLKSVYSIFPPENIRLFLFEEMLNEMSTQLNEMCGLLNLEEFAFSTSVKYNERKEPNDAIFSKLLSPAKNNQLVKILSLKQRIKLKRFLKGKISKKNEIAGKKVIDKNTREYLINIFGPEMDELADFTKLPIKQFWPELFN